VWQGDLLVTKPDGCLPRTSELMKLLEHGGDALLNLTVWRLFDATLFGANKTDWDFPQSKTTPHFLLESCTGALS
jgi:hypothetical protein